MALLGFSMIALMASSLIKSVASPLLKEDGIIPLLALPLLPQVIFQAGATRAGKATLRADRGCNNMNHFVRNIYFFSIL